jgi:hypothetical protein
MQLLASHNQNSHRRQPDDLFRAAAQQHVSHSFTPGCAPKRGAS